MTMTELEALNEATLLLTRKLRRLHPEAYAELMGRLPEEAREALDRAERAADRLRFQGDELGWPESEYAGLDEEE